MPWSASPARPGDSPSWRSRRRTPSITCWPGDGASRRTTSICAIRRQHHAVLRLKAYLDTAHRLAGRDAVGPAELEHVTALVRYHEAMEAERIACRALMVQDRDARGWAIPADGEREYALVLDWTTRKRDMAQVKADWHVSRSAQDRKLFGCKAISRANWVISCRELHAARAEVALHEAECARVAWKLAAPRGLRGRRTRRIAPDPDRQWPGPRPLPRDQGGRCQEPPGSG